VQIRLKNHSCDEGVLGVGALMGVDTWVVGRVRGSEESLMECCSESKIVRSRGGCGGSSKPDATPARQRTWVEAG